jgi:hypothetical protein
MKRMSNEGTPEQECDIHQAETFGDEVRSRSETPDLMSLTYVIYFDSSASWHVSATAWFTELVE